MAHNAGSRHHFDYGPIIPDSDGLRLNFNAAALFNDVGNVQSASV